MKKIKLISLLALSVFILACSGEKEEAKPATPTTTESTSVPGDKVPTDENAQKMTEKPSTESVVQETVTENAENATKSAVETVEKTTDKIGEELDKAGDKVKDKIDEGVDAIKEKVAN
ncbi:MAG: hypothetical protein ACRC8M_02280 [Cetobacterium sp.]|uniref:hypothetical protein n=1 Tax=Cetobacterium sp. TaxID=2071632 RepID=UPI003F383E7F